MKYKENIIVRFDTFAVDKGGNKVYFYNRVDNSTRRDLTNKRLLKMTQHSTSIVNEMISVISRYIMFLK